MNLAYFRSTLTVLAALAVAALALAVPAQASTIVPIDPDGPGPQALIQVGALDWNVGNSIMLNLGSGTSQVYAQGNLANFDNPGPIAGTGLNVNYEWTYDLGFLNSVSQTCLPDCTNPTSMLTQLTSISGGDNFFRIWFDPSKDSNPLTGTGYTNGTMILEGFIEAGGGNNFTAQNLTGICSTGVTCAATPNGSPIPLDNFGPNNYPGMSSVTGSGGGQIAIHVTFANPAFFLTNPVTLLVDFTTKNAPFGQTDPSLQFTNGAGSPVAGATIASIGACNGCLGTNPGPVTPSNPTNTAPNVMVQVDANSSFGTTAVPEPSSLLLVSLGLVCVTMLTAKYRSAIKLD